MDVVYILLFILIILIAIVILFKPAIFMAGGNVDNIASDKITTMYNVPTEILGRGDKDECIYKYFRMVNNNEFIDNDLLCKVKLLLLSHRNEYERQLKKFMDTEAINLGFLARLESKKNTQFEYGFYPDLHKLDIVNKQHKGDSYKILHDKLQELANIEFNNRIKDINPQFKSIVKYEHSDFITYMYGGKGVVSPQVINLYVNKNELKASMEKLLNYYEVDILHYDDMEYKIVNRHIKELYGKYKEVFDINKFNGLINDKFNNGIYPKYIYKQEMKNMLNELYGEFSEYYKSKSEYNNAVNLLDMDNYINIIATVGIIYYPHFTFINQSIKLKPIKEHIKRQLFIQLCRDLKINVERKSWSKLNEEGKQININKLARPVLLKYIGEFDKLNRKRPREYYCLLSKLHNNYMLDPFTQFYLVFDINEISPDDIRKRLARNIADKYLPLVSDKYYELEQKAIEKELMADFSTNLIELSKETAVQPTNKLHNIMIESMQILNHPQSKLYVPKIIKIENKVMDAGNNDISNNDTANSDGNNNQANNINEPIKPIDNQQSSPNDIIDNQTNIFDNNSREPNNVNNTNTNDSQQDAFNDISQQKINEYPQWKLDKVNKFLDEKGVPKLGNSYEDTITRFKLYKTLSD